MPGRPAAAAVQPAVARRHRRDRRHPRGAGRDSPAAQPPRRRDGSRSSVAPPRTSRAPRSPATLVAGRCGRAPGVGELLGRLVRAVPDRDARHAATGRSLRRSRCSMLGVDWGEGTRRRRGLRESVRRHLPDPARPGARAYYRWAGTDGLPRHYFVGEAGPCCARSSVRSTRCGWSRSSRRCWRTARPGAHARPRDRWVEAEVSPRPRRARSSPPDGRRRRRSTCRARGPGPRSRRSRPR